ncbi:winged helix-turn-helix domain-containing protein [Streptomyces sp. N50]|uniref:helix-turn-helix domain-containing protein n=1 Tax=Streptomyces sp. N50 TaxID=3081765 RepID=UPI002961F4C8|nr:winged helix-turn-helix domain-containing protein [Streptomyces sp. N50]WOX12667.1 winged helix-turn-helix domain-containing protein [Streptomyces sp. N50]
MASDRREHGGAGVLSGSPVRSRHGWSWQQPARRAIERDDDAVELWKKGPGHGEKHRGGARCRGSCAPTRPGSR